MGRDPTKVNDQGNEDKIYYPSVSIGPDDYPPLTEMKLGEIAAAEIQFRISRHGGVELLGMKHLGSVDEKAEKDKQTLLKRHKKNQMQMSGMSSDSSSPVE